MLSNECYTLVDINVYIHINIYFLERVREEGIVWGGKLGGKKEQEHGKKEEKKGLVVPVGHSPLSLSLWNISFV